ncbi:hypothetical protein HYS47_02245 [Candidatus Woesearchaeota archaeon]|nr:hypothetical protein [Candidatus Woesearchaeota archaeon]
MVRLLSKTISLALLLLATGCGDGKADSCKEGGLGDPANDSQTQSSSCADPGGCSYDLSTVTPCTCRYTCMEAYNCGALVVSYPNSVQPFLDCFNDCEAQRQQDEQGALEVMDCIDQRCDEAIVQDCRLGQ